MAVGAGPVQEFFSVGQPDELKSGGTIRRNVCVTFHQNFEAWWAWQWKAPNDLTTPLIQHRRGISCVACLRDWLTLEPSFFRVFRLAPFTQEPIRNQSGTNQPNKPCETY